MQGTKPSTQTKTIKEMKSISQLRKTTSSLQSMIVMNSTELNVPVVGMFLTLFYHTDRRSQKITKVEGNKFFVENGSEYFFSKKGIKFITYEGKKTIAKNARITENDLTYFDVSF